MQSDVEQEIAALENLHRSGTATWQDLNRLGVAYHRDRNFSKALHYYAEAASAKATRIPWYNMGLVFNDPEISQDADAVDAYRRALAIEPDYEQAQKQLEITRKKLAPLAKKARAAAGAVVSDKPFEFYISPFEAFRLDGIAYEQLNARTIQRAKKLLLQELDLNDGSVGWLDGYSLDKSHALALEDELHNETKRRYHWAIFQNKQLLQFLTHGDIEHFLYSDDYFPHDTRELLDRESAFRAFLSEPFSRQYDRTLTRAIKQNLLPVVEVLFDGRRWVEPAHEDTCFRGAYQQAETIVQKARVKVSQGESRKISVGEIAAFLRQHCLPDLFNLLPPHFAPYQEELVDRLRSLAISSNNEHGDPSSAESILGLCKQFTSRSVALAESLKEDMKAVEEILRRRRLQAVSHLRQRSLQARAPSSHAAQPSGEKPRAAKSSTAATTPTQTTSQATRDSPSSVFVWTTACAVAVPAFVIIVAIWASGSDSTPTAPSAPKRTTPSSRSYVPARPTSGRSNRSIPVSPARTDRDSGTVYQVPSYISAQLDRESRVIDHEKATAQRMESELERLDREIERNRAYLDQTSQFAVDAFNRKVNDYNAKAERLKAQNRRINQLVDSYNAKLRQFSR